jgi:hypothetical protein
MAANDRPKFVRCALCSGKVEVKPTGRIPDRHPRCKDIAQAMADLSRLLEGEVNGYEPFPADADPATAAHLRSELWRMGNAITNTRKQRSLRNLTGNAKRVSKVAK